jgi:F0F1-type ATP synthase membrane subunit c/vacuolar-type H+-ATPase subunit K
LTVVLPSTLILTTDGITFSSIGARLGIGCAVAAVDDALSAAVTASGDIARPKPKPKLRASVLIAKVVFFIFLNLDLPDNAKLLCKLRFVLYRLVPE